MKRIFFILSFLYAALTGTAQEADVFSGARWIGAITRSDAHLPQGRTFGGEELRKPEVKAAWAAVDTLAKKSICIRKEFDTTDGKGVKEAIAHICGLGFYELTMNGQKVGESEFAPLWSDYDKSVFYNTYDVTALIRDGQNAIGVLLGNGFYNVQGGRYRKLLISFGPPTLLFTLVIRYEDGRRQIVTSSGDGWKYDLSPVTFNCIYGGEDYDASREQPGWNLPRFDDSRWRTVVLQQAPKGTLRKQIAPPVKIMERYGVRKQTKLDRQDQPTAFVLDMGQNLAGFPEITVRGKRGQTVTLFVSESLTPEGACDQRRTGKPHFYRYTLKGGGKEKWHPRFSYYGYRYIQVEGAVMKGEKNPKRLPILEDIQSCFVYNSAREVSTFECSNPLFNATHRLIGKAARSNMQSVFTDCPHREKLGWLEQVHLNGPGLLYNYDLSTYGRQMTRNMADAQHPDGAMPTTAPEYLVFQGPGMEPFAQSPEWGASLVIFPFMYQREYGDDSLIREYYPQMRRYVDYLETRAEGHILSFGLGDWYDYEAGFRAGFSRNTPVPLVATAHYYMIASHLAKAASIVGNTFDAQYYDTLSRQILTAFNRRFFHADTGQYGTGSQCGNALPLFLDMVPDGERERVLNHLVEDIRAHGNRLTTGDVGNRYLIQSLAANNLDELVYQMFNHEDAPGYGFQLKFGATTLTEQWDPREGSSWNHFMMGQIDEWFFRSLAGIRPGAEGGYRLFEIRPCPVGDLRYVKASHETRHGTITVDWRRTGENFILNITVPPGTQADVWLPGETHAKRVPEGAHQLQTCICPATFSYLPKCKLALAQARNRTCPSAKSRPGKLKLAVGQVFVHSRKSARNYLGRYRDRVGQGHRNA